MASLTYNASKDGFDIVYPSGATGCYIEEEDLATGVTRTVYTGNSTQAYNLGLTKGRKKAKGHGLPGGSVFAECYYTVV